MRIIEQRDRYAEFRLKAEKKSFPNDRWQSSHFEEIALCDY
jgi:hypothetical protein